MSILTNIFHRDSDSSELSISDHSDCSVQYDLAPASIEPRIGTLHTHLISHAPSRSITIHEDTAGGCGGRTWPAATILSNYISHRRLLGTFPYSRIIELGAGTGLVSLTVAVLPNEQSVLRSSELAPTAPVSITITDLEEFVPLISFNAKLNLTEQELKTISIETCRWGDPLSQHIKAAFPFDLILVADCVYLEAAFDPLIKTLTDLSTRSTEIWIAFKKRRSADRHFWTRLAKTFHVEPITDDPNHHDYSRKRLFLYKAMLKSPFTKNTVASTKTVQALS
ncbi:hypothetical protein BATDEDRAFT_24524 [Batrachochytrium dendrobatidis JAM81]|uniref:Protein-lysine N-methyltransferase EFM6 n=2 Tax=Batrachochytrium dendrobatidis TaxID=109871 RepID=F4P186_BATDJ|nr:uncharacterized protein BATDEDRAFT_24524 [Batrachochytrium dendrobatidis JAM81]EGF80956.1 hypothetical protein BATDEDRAFT_24524 [Batrachochytrium dendrobatidis JAM81]OAJ41727.1 hypothetical protein BDEG_25279 [Batrachochytrium dendrobatidis JEL423]|eukprot:XP_006678475.1 hypothetical protein BATDEDRAFT_24524 [Batrachochytrium dendrobatidis JAM81]